MLEPPLLPPDPNGTTPPRSRGAWLATVALSLLLLPLLFASQLWALVETGRLPPTVGLPPLLLLLLGSVLLAVWRFDGVAGREMRMLRSGAVLVGPLLLSGWFDQPPASGVQVGAWLFVLLQIWRSTAALDRRDREGVLLTGGLLLTITLIIVVVTGRWRPAGPCHLLSELRAAGCLRSFAHDTRWPTSAIAPAFLRDPDGGPPHIVRVRGRQLWVEPADRLAAFARGYAIRTAIVLAAVFATADGGRLLAFDWLMVGNNPTQFYASPLLLIDPADGRTLDTRTLDVRTLDAQAAVADAPDEAVRATALSDDGRWQARAFTDGQIAVWQQVPPPLLDGDLRQLPPFDPTPPDSLTDVPPTWAAQLDGVSATCLTVAPDGQKVAVGTADPAAVYLVDQTQIVTLQLHASCGAFTPDGALFIAITSGDNPTLRLFAASDGTPRAQVALPLADYRSDFALSPDGALLAVTLRDGRALLFDVVRLVARGPASQPD